MKLAFSFFLIICSFVTHACLLNNAGNFVSLSAPITYTFKELGWLNKKNVSAISVFHQVDKSEFDGEQLGGGVFLAEKKLLAFKDKVFFIDQSQDIVLLFKKLNLKFAIVDSRGLDPFEVFEKTLKIIEPFTENCQEHFKKLRDKFFAIEKKIVQLNIKLPPLFFYLGSFIHQRPNLVMVQDGFVKWLIKEKQLKTYPSPLAYVSWSEKILREFISKDKLVEIGLVTEDKTPNWILIKKDKNHFQYDVRGSTILLPGITQIYFLENFLQEMPIEILN